jgi:adenine phosphoribosyltransferase
MSYDGRVHTVHIGGGNGGLTRHLPIFQVAPGVKIAIFNMLGDTEVVEVAADQLAKRMPANTQVLITPEVKAVPLGHALAVRTGLPLVIVRKVRKPYMANCLEAQVVSITTGAPQTLYLDGKDLSLVQGKNALLLDDVISTGSTLKGLHQLMAKAQATVVGEMAVFTEGGPADWSNVIALGHLPIFTD